MTSNPPASRGRLARIWPWAVASAPALALLAMIVPLRVAVPHLDGWAYVQQYQEWIAGRYGWADLFARHYVHPSAVGKLIYLATLHWFGGDLGLLPLLNWGLAVVTAACVCLLARPLWNGNPKTGAVLMLGATLTIFSPAQGEAWVWAFLFQNAIAGTCLAAGLLVLSPDPIRPWRVAAAGLLSLVATFSFGSGFLVGLLLSLTLWQRMAGRSALRKGLAVGAWLGWNGLVAWAALVAAAGRDVGGHGLTLPDDPLMRLRFVLILLGQMLAKGTAFEPRALGTVAGAVLLAGFIAGTAWVIRRGRDRILMREALPWISFGLYGLATAALICRGRMHGSLSPALRERYVTFTLFFVLGTVLLAATVLRHGHSGSASFRWMRRAAVPLFWIFIAATLVNWEWGHHAMLIKSKHMEQERALLGFCRILPLDPEWMEIRSTRKSTAALAIFLADSGRLPGVRFVRDRRIATFPRRAPLSKEWARLEKPVLLEDGGWRLEGTGGWSGTTAADLVLITAEAPNQEEQIMAVTAPLLPDTFFERREERRSYPEHYFGWSKTLSPGTLPGGRTTLRAYVFEEDSQWVRPLDGAYTVDSGPPRQP